MHRIGSDAFLKRMRGSVVWEGGIWVKTRRKRVREPGGCLGREGQDKGTVCANVWENMGLTYEIIEKASKAGVEWGWGVGDGWSQIAAWRPSTRGPLHPSGGHSKSLAVVPRGPWKLLVGHWGGLMSDLSCTTIPEYVENRIGSGEGRWCGKTS